MTAYDRLTCFFSKTMESSKPRRFWKSVLPSPRFTPTPSSAAWSRPRTAFMLEDRSIEIWAYNLETVLAEKLETVVSRATANTRMRDFYDLHILSQLHGRSIVPASVRRSLQRLRNAVQRSILPTRLRPLMKSRPTQTWKSCGGLIRRSSPTPPTCRGIRSWNPSAAFIGWHRGKRPTNRNLTEETQIEA